MTISLRLSDEDSLCIKKYAELKGLTVSELIRQSVLDRIEEEYDLETYKKAVLEYQEDPTTYSHTQVRQMLNLDK